MHLALCPRPQEPLENAPRTALLEAPRENSAPGDTWEGFWSAQSDDYFVRCTSSDGTTQWFRVEDESSAASPSCAAEPHVVPLRANSRGQMSLVLAWSPNGRRMLVGSARRTSR